MFYRIFQLLYKLVLLFDFLILTTIMYAISCMPRFLMRNLYRRLFGWWCNEFIRILGIQLHINEHHLKKLPKQYIVISNHPSIFEDVGMPATFFAHFLAKQEVKNWWIVGRIAAAAGVLFVIREDQDSRTAARKQMIDTLKAGHSIGLFPEGGCKGRRIHTPFKSAAFDISLETGLPIIPVFLHYEAQNTFEWMEQSVLGMIWDVFTAKNKHVHYHIHDPLYPTQFDNRDHYRAHTENVYKTWEKKYLD